jgi:hypothetical protein
MNLIASPSVKRFIKLCSIDQWRFVQYRHVRNRCNVILGADLIKYSVGKTGMVHFSINVLTWKVNILSAHEDSANGKLFIKHLREVLWRGYENNR